jgi:hypothetical protein
MSLCLPGLQGFPIQVTGWTSTNDRSKYIIPSDISLQFSPTKLPMAYNQGTFNINGQNTFFIGGSQYFIKAIRLCATKQTGLSTLTPIAEFHIWGYPTATSINQKSIALLNIPIFSGIQNTKQGDAFIELLSNRPVVLGNLIPTGPDVNVVRYSTCVETNNDTINIIIAYWDKGLIIAQDLVKNIPQPLKEFGIPVLGGFKILSSHVISEKGKTNRIYTEKDNIQQAYPGSITATNTDFTNSFRYITGFIDQVSSDKYDTNAYKCVTIDPSRDIKNGKILIDPESGKRLSQTVEDAEAEAKLNQEIPSVSSKYIIETMSIIIGVILGLGLLLGLFYLIYTFITTRKSTGDPPMDPKVAAAINAVGTIAGNSTNT